MAGLGKTRPGYDSPGGRKKRKRKPPKVEVSGPYRDQSSVPSIRAEAQPDREHRKVTVTIPPPTPESVGLGAPDLEKLPSRSTREAEQRIHAILEGLNPTGGFKASAPAPTVPTLTEHNPSNKPGFAPTKAEALATPVLSDLEKLHDEGKIGKTLGQEIYDKVAEWGPTAITLGPEAKVTLEALSTALKGVEVGSTRVGGIKAIVKAAPVENTPEALAATAKRAAQRAESEASGVVKRTGERIARTQSKADRQLAKDLAGTPGRKAYVQEAGLALKAGKAGAAQTLPVVQGHEQALLDNPKKTLGTTLRAAPGLVTAPAGLVIHGGVTAGRAVSEGLHEAGVPGFRGYTGEEILAPAKEEIDAQIDFAKQVAKVITADDPEFVQEEVENNLGLLLPLTTGLIGKAVLDKVGRGRVTAAVQKLAESVREVYGREHGADAKVFEVAGQRKAEAKSAAATRLRIKREVADRAKQIRAEASRARGSETVRELPKGKKLKIHAGDLVGFTVRHGLPLDNPTRALEETRRIGSQLRELPKDVHLPENELQTRDVIAYIDRNPKVLEDKHLAKAVALYRQQGEYARSVPELALDSSERARHLSIGSTHRVTPPEERVPLEARKYTNAGTRAEAWADLEARDRRLEELQRKLREGTNPQRRPGEGRQYRPTAAPDARTIARRKAEADRLFAENKKLYEALKDYTRPDQNPGKSQRLAYDKHLIDEYSREVQDTIKQKGLAQPEYVYTGRAREAPVQGATGAKISNVPGKTKFRTGSAEEYGMVREGLGPLLSDSISRPVARRHIFAALRDFLARNEVRVGQQTEFTGTQARQLFDDGTINRNTHVLIPAQLYQRAYDHIAGKESELPDEEWIAQARASLEQQKTDAELVGDGRTYKIVPRAAAQEFFDQMTSNRVIPGLAKVNQATAFLILGTSPAWAAMQILAESAQAALARPKLLNPLYVRKLIKAYEEMPPEKRQAFESWVGVTSRTIDTADDIKLGLDSGDMGKASSAFNVMNRTAVGKLIKGIPNSIRAVDQWKGGRLRVLVAAAKIDADMNGRLNSFLRGMGQLYRAEENVSRKIKDKPLSEQLAYWSDHPKVAEKYQTYLDDVMGNWSALTQNERVASQLVIFYPFMRMSLRWTLYSFPKQHPIKAAIAYWLAQQNAEELHRLLQGDPSFFTEWANVPLHLGPNEVEELPLARAAVGASAPIEAAGGATDLGKGALRSLQPAVAAAITAMTGVNPLSGEQESFAGWQALAQLMMLSPLTRAADQLTIPQGEKRADGAPPIFGATEQQEALDKLYRKLHDPTSTDELVRKLAAPVLPRDIETQQDFNHLNRIMETLSETGSSKQRELAAEPSSTRKEFLALQARNDKAEQELHQLYRKYGIDYVPEEERFNEHYGRVYYGDSGNQPGPVTIGGTTIGEASVGTEGSEPFYEGGEVTIGGQPIGPKPKVKATVRPRKEPAGVSIGGVPIG